MMQSSKWMQRGVRAIFSLAIAAISLPGFGADPLTKEQGEQILQELRQMRQLLERAVTPQAQPAAMPAKSAPVAVNVKTAMALGRADAPVTMIAFTDYQCPFCRRFEVDTFPEIKKRYIDTGKLRFVVRDLPLPFHPNAHKAAQASHCAGEQGQYWTMRDKMTGNIERLEGAALGGYARELGLREAEFSKCLDSGKFSEAVDKSAAEAQQLGISGTPTFVIGKTDSDTVTGDKMVGAMPFTVFDQKIREMLGG